MLFFIDFIYIYFLNQEAFNGSPRFSASGIFLYFLATTSTSNPWMVAHPSANRDCLQCSYGNRCFQLGIRCILYTSVLYTYFVFLYHTVLSASKFIFVNWKVYRIFTEHYAVISCTFLSNNVQFIFQQFTDKKMFR